MKNEQSEGRLFAVLIVFIVSIGILHGRKEAKIEAGQFDMPNQMVCFSALSLDQVYNYLHTVVISRNLSLVGQIIAQFPEKMVKNLVQKIIENKKIALTPHESLNLLFALMYYSSEKKTQFDLFNLLNFYPTMQKEPILLLLARSPYHDIVPEFLQWVKTRVHVTQKKELLEKYIIRPIKCAIDDNDLVSLELLVTKKLRITSQQATQLLWYTIDKNKNTYFVPFFVQRGANINYVNEKGVSLLMRAVKENNEAMVRTLLEAGALVNLIDNPTVNLLQIAIGYGHDAIVSLLREYNSF
ncbi:MAG: ankyrin repeat domain-containing protein [Candidatus Babeliales bacterium]